MTTSIRNKSAPHLQLQLDATTHLQLKHKRHELIIGLLVLLPVPLYYTHTYCLFRISVNVCVFQLAFMPPQTQTPHLTSHQTAVGLGLVMANF